MKSQQVNVDFWAMGKAMLMYVAMTAMGWLMLRVFNTMFMLPRRLRSQQENLQNTLQELQSRFPNLNITEEDLKNADKELEAFVNEEKEQEEKINEIAGEPQAVEESKKSI